MNANNFHEIKKIYNEYTCYDMYAEQFSDSAIDGLNSFISRYYTASKFFLKNTLIEDMSSDNIFSSFFFDGNLSIESDLINDEASMFMDWYLNKGYKYITDLIFNINGDNLDERLYSFIEYYDFSMRDAIEENNIEVLVDFLYKIPGTMKEEFEKFGFLFKKEIKIQYEYELDITINTEKEEIFIELEEPDIYQAFIVAA